MGKPIKHKLDLRGLLTPFTLLKVSQMFRSLKPGERLEILWGDADSPDALFKVLPDADYDLISMSEVGKEHPYYRIRLQKKGIVETA